MTIDIEQANRTAVERMTAARPMLTGLLRQELGFSGAVVSDSLLMEGVKVGCANEGELALETLNAGVDMLLDCSARSASGNGAAACARAAHGRGGRASRRCRRWRRRQRLPSPRSRIAGARRCRVAGLPYQ